MDCQTSAVPPIRKGNYRRASVLRNTTAGHVGKVSVILVAATKCQCLNGAGAKSLSESVSRAIITVKTQKVCKEVIFLFLSLREVL